jgi:hypothetical protein
LHSALLYAVEDDDTINLVQRRWQLIGPDHLGDDGDHRADGESKGGSEKRKGEGIVVWRVSEKVRPQTLFLDFPIEGDERKD